VALGLIYVGCDEALAESACKETSSLPEHQFMDLGSTFTNTVYLGLMGCA
jgi:hypothetical protein